MRLQDFSLTDLARLNLENLYSIHGLIPITTLHGPASQDLLEIPYKRQTSYSVVDACLIALKIFFTISRLLQIHIDLLAFFSLAET